MSDDTDLGARKELLKRALAELKQARAKARAMCSAPVAVVGVGCRFPGGVCSVEGFWEFLEGGGDGVVGVPVDRWDAEALFDSDLDALGREGGFIGGVDEFDDRFFGISPREAVSMDPQQRLVLEVGWEALEHASIAPDCLRDSETGVFVGLGASDYLLRSARSMGVAEVDAYVGTGNAASVASGRLSYVLGLRGPSMVVDTACSSSLVAVHLACQSLRGGECDLALAGGVNLMLAADTTVVLSKARMLSPTGRCRTFDAAADGYVRGEGCGIVVLRRLEDALAAGERVLGVIRGSAVNQDGRSSGLTVPYAAAQERVVGRALAVAGLVGGDIGYLEAHGTGTSLGDPIEVGAFARVLGGGRERPLIVGSVKTNIGHLEAAAGVAGLIKAILVVLHGRVPPHLHLRELNPRVPWQDLPLVVPTETMVLPAGRRLAGVSSFGFSGTNAHVIVEGPPADGRLADGRLADGLLGDGSSGDGLLGEGSSGDGLRGGGSSGGGLCVGRGWVLVKVAARGRDALVAAASLLALWVQEHPDARLDAVAWVADVGRAELPDRAAVVASSREELVEGLRAIAAGDSARGVVRGVAALGGSPKSAFLAPGQGARVAGVAAELYRFEPVFRRVLDSLVDPLGPLDELPLALLLETGEDAQQALGRTEHVQPALYALAVALGEWWRAAGVLPDVLVGHSVGAYAAAALAGVFSLEDGARVVAARGRLMSSLAPGAMAAVFSDEATVQKLLEQSGEQTIELTALNTPTETVLAGEERALERFLGTLRAQGVSSKRLGVARAFHTRQVEPILQPLQAELAAITLHAPVTPLISDTTGELAGEEVAAPAYWIAHARHATHFERALRTLATLGCRQLIELGPTTTLLGMAQTTLNPEEHTLLPSLRPSQPASHQLLQSAANAWIDGTPLNWRALNDPRPPQTPHLPSYPFQRRRHWLPENNTPNTPTPHTIPTPLPHHITQMDVSIAHQRYLAEHRIHGHVVVPGVTYLELLLAASQAAAAPEAGVGEASPLTVQELALLQPLIMASEGSYAMQAIVDPPKEDGTRKGRIYSRRHGSESEWTLHATAALANRRAPLQEVVPLADIRERLSHELSREDFYSRVWHPEFHLGESFRLVERAWLADGEALGIVRVADRSLAGVRDGIRAELLTLDACAQLLVACRWLRDMAEDARPLTVGAGFACMRASEVLGHSTVWCWARLDDDRRLGASGALVIADADGRRLAEVDGVAFRAISDATMRRIASERAAASAAPSTAMPGLAAPSRAELLAIDVGERERIVEGHLLRRLAAVLALSPEDVDAGVSITDIADSLMLAELKMNVDADFGVSLPLERLFEQPTIAATAAWLVDAIEPTAASEAKAASMSLEQLLAEAALDPTIVPSAATELPRVLSPRAVLLTGATEFVGAHILARLLERTDAQVHCLVDAGDADAALDEIHLTLERYAIGCDMGSRVVPVIGSLRRSALGLTKEAFSGLATEIDIIYHTGTATQWTYPFSALKPVNIEATREILRLATLASPRPVNLLSTVGVFSSPEYADRVVSETEPLENVDGLALGYAQTRWVAEQMARVAAARGLPVIVHRAAVGPNSRTGCYEQNHHMSMMLRACVELQRVPDTELPLQLAPVDYIAASLVELSLRGGCYGRSFHLVNPRVVTWRELAGLLAAAGYPVSRVPLEEWRRRLSDRLAEDRGTALSAFMPFLEGSIEQVRLPRFDCVDTLAALSGTSVSCPPLDSALLRLHLSHTAVADIDGADTSARSTRARPVDDLDKSAMRR